MSEMIKQTTYRYRLEPGDATRYEFSLTFLNNVKSVISGVGNGGEYVTITLHNTGVYEFSINSLVHDWQSYSYWHYVQSKLPDAHLVYLVPVLAAISVLVLAPSDISRAELKMMESKDALDAHYRGVSNE